MKRGSWFHQIWLLSYLSSCSCCWLTWIRCQTNYWPLRSRETRTYHRPPGGVKGFRQWVTDLRGEDVVGHIPDSLFSFVVGVAHSFHFGEDRADCRVRGLVAFLIDENPPVRDKGSILSALRFPLHPRGKGTHKGQYWHDTAHSQQHNYQGLMCKWLLSCNVIAVLPVLSPPLRHITESQNTDVYQLQTIAAGPQPLLKESKSSSSRM